MLGIFKTWLKTKQAKMEAELAQQKAITEALRLDEDPDPWTIVAERDLSHGQMTKLLQEESNVINTKNEGDGWQLLGSAWKGHVALDQQIMILQARKFYRYNPLARAAVMGKVKYVMGKGLSITPKSKDPRIWHIWREFWTSPRNNMALRQFEIPKRLIRDGEIFIRFYTKNGDGAETGKTTIRFIDPIDVRRTGDEGVNTTDKTNQGIVFDPNDAEKPLAYFTQDRLDPAKFEKVDASEVLHVKLHADMDQPRGETDIQPIMTMFTYYKSWLENRIILNKLRTAIVMVREIEAGSATDINTFKSTLPQSARSVSGDNKKQSIRPGTFYTAPPGVKLRMEAANINASDVKDDGRAMILQMAAGTGLPEYMFGDASNANYSSTMIAESPFVKEIQFLQSYIENTVWKEIYRRVVQAAVDAKLIQDPKDEDIFKKYPNGAADLTEAENEKDEDPDSFKRETEREVFFGCDVEWPEVIHRDPKMTADSLAVLLSQGLVSHSTAAAVAGYEYPEEVRKERQIIEDAEAKGNPLLNVRQGEMGEDLDGQAGDQEMDAEMKDLLKTLTPEQREKVKNGSPEEVVQMVKSMMKSNGQQKTPAGEKP